MTLKAEDILDKKIIGVDSFQNKSYTIDFREAYKWIISPIIS